MEFAVNDFDGASANAVLLAPGWRDAGYPLAEGVAGSDSGTLPGFARRNWRTNEYGVINYQEVTNAIRAEQ